METRIVSDSMGEMAIPAGAYWGAQTERARLNFPDTGHRPPLLFIHVLSLIKGAAAQANRELGLLDENRFQAIATASREVAEGKWDDHFVIDLFQTGSGTSTHMNVNEVIATRANEILGFPPGNRQGPIHPNDHVNMGQSSNDCVPTAIHLSARLATRDALLPPLDRLMETLKAHARNWDKLIKPGRTHLQDATPVRIGQVFSGYAASAAGARARLLTAAEGLDELALGGTAVGSGINTHPRFAARVLAHLSDLLQLPLRESSNHFAAQSTLDGVYAFSSALAGLATALMKIANDLRWLSSGPRTGLAEFSLPKLQPGSSIMPGKVNPVMPEMLLQICLQVLGHHQVVCLAAQRSEFELNVFLPLTLGNLLSAIDILGKGMDRFEEACLKGLTPNADHCRRQAQKSLSIVTPLAKRWGYDRAAAWAKRALQENRSLAEVVGEEGDVDPEELIALLDPMAMTGGWR